MSIGTATAFSVQNAQPWAEPCSFVEHYRQHSKEQRIRSVWEASSLPAPCDAASALEDLGTHVRSAFLMVMRVTSWEREHSWHQAWTDYLEEIQSHTSAVVVAYRPLLSMLLNETYDRQEAPEKPSLAGYLCLVQQWADAYDQEAASISEEEYGDLLDSVFPQESGG
ncbi:MAG: hypothetical protein GX620_16290 [Chloroflexi bacterium]|nr:hypothetical protein [Chloroflexota bacterium]